MSIEQAKVVEKILQTPPKQDVEVKQILEHIKDPQFWERIKKHFEWQSLKATIATSSQIESFKKELGSNELTALEHAMSMIQSPPKNTQEGIQKVQEIVTTTMANDPEVKESIGMFWKIMEHIKSGNIMSAIGVILWWLGFKDMFGGMFSKFFGDNTEEESTSSIGDVAASVTGKISETVTAEKNKLQEKAGDAQKLINNEVYSKGINILYLTHHDKGNNNIKAILNTPECKSLSFEEMVALSQRESGIAHRSKLGAYGTDREVLEAIKLFTNNKKFLESIFGKQLPGWKKEPVISLVGKLAKEGAQLNNIKSHLTNASNPQEALEKLEQLDPFGVKEINGEMFIGGSKHQESMLKKLSFGSVRMLHNSNPPIKNDIQSKNLVLSMTNKSPSESAVVDKLFTYYVTILPQLTTLFGEWHKSAYVEYFKKNGINSKDLLELYVITGGNPNISLLSDIKKSEIYLKMAGITKWDKYFQWAHYIAPLAIQWNTVIPDNVGYILNGVVGHIGRSAVNSVKNTADLSTGSISGAVGETLNVIKNKIIG